jgi:hypothetical protein
LATTFPKDADTSDILDVDFLGAGEVTLLELAATLGGTIVFDKPEDFGLPIITGKVAYY